MAAWSVDWFITEKLLPIPLPWLFGLSLVGAIVLSETITAVVSTLMIGEVPTVCWVIAFLAPTIIATGELLLMCALIAHLRDRNGRLSEAKSELQRQTDEAVRASLQAQSEAQARTDLVAQMSHEVRTPMNGILGMAQLLLDTKLDKDQRDCVETIHYSGTALVSMLSDVLGQSKIEAGHSELGAVSFDLRRLVQRLIELMSSQARALQISCDIADDVPDCFAGDPVRLHQILVNLMSNAIKFTDRGSVAVQVDRVGGTANRPLLRFSVSDTGIGIGEETQANLFADYVQADESIARTFGGTGLGLSICRRLVTLMGGHIDVDSEPGKGSRFWFEIPLTVATRPTQPDSPLVPTTARRPLRILLAEDNLVNQKVAIAMLARQGHEVVAVADGLAAVEALIESRFDLVLMDLQMPRLDGVQATLRIRGLPGPEAAIPILAITASATDADMTRCQAAGMDGFVSKPFSPASLAAAIAGLWRGPAA